MTLTKDLIDYKKHVHLFSKQIHVFSGICLSNLPSHRLLITFLSLFLLTACNQPEQQASLLKTQALSKSSAKLTNVYGRKAVFSYPEFSGSYSVSSHSVVITDFSRAEIFIRDSFENRKLQIRFYYPSSTKSSLSAGSNKLPVISKQAWDYLVGPHQHAGKMLRFDNYRDAKWDITLNNEVDPGQPNYPVLVFSHGYGFSAESYSALSAELASRGYIVVSINHTYGANPSNLGNDQFVWAKSLPADGIGNYVPIWSDDQIFVINQLTAINADPNNLFYRKLDLVNLGVFGHSYGGAAAYLTASRDPQVKAVIDIDGTIFDAQNQYINQPFALLLSKHHQPKFNYTNAGGEAYEIRFKNFEHVSFTDRILWWQWDHDNQNLGLGKVEAHRAIELTTEIIDDFFIKYLALKSSQWFEQEELVTEEITLQRKN